jgi:hypothetical protein
MCGCPLSFYGHVAVGPAGKPGEVPDAARREPGNGDPNVVEKLAVRPGDWPCSGGDNRRTLATAVALSDKLKRQWTFRPPSAAHPTAPVTAGGLVFAGDESGVLRALDATSGKVKWQAYTAGAIFQPPAVWEGRVYVGAADGRIYAFEAATGRRLWTFLAAPDHRWIPVYGKLQSTWPVAGGVVVEDGVLYAAAGIAHYDGTHVWALDAVTGNVRWHNGSSGQLSDRGASGARHQGELGLEGGAVCFDGGGVYPTARYDLNTGQCLNVPVHAVGSQHATAFYPYYPEYGQYVSLDHRLSDGRRLTHSVVYEGSQHTALAMLRPARPGDPAPPAAPKIDFRRPGGPVPGALWERRGPRKFNGFVVGPKTLLAAGQAAEEGKTKPFLAAIDFKDGADLWQEELPTAAVRGGVATDRAGRVLVALDDGRLVCFGPAD